MQTPNEFKSKTFTRSVRGYSTAEVDEYIKTLVASYEGAYNEIIKLRGELAAAEQQLAESNSEAIREELINAQRASIQITRSANEKADLILRSTKESCDRTLYAFRLKLRDEREKLAQLIGATQAFRDKLLSEYATQIDIVSEMTVSPNAGDIVTDEDDIVAEVVRETKEGVTAGMAKKEEEEAKIASEQAAEHIKELPTEPIDLDTAYRENGKARAAKDATDRIFDSIDEQDTDEDIDDAEDEDDDDDLPDELFGNDDK